MNCGEFDYDCLKRECNRTGVYSSVCLDYFLSLPKGDVGVNRNRQDFAAVPCQDIRNLTQPQCRLLCRDAPALCRTNRLILCNDISLSDARTNTIPTTSQLYQASLTDPSLKSLCSCYLNQSQNQLAVTSVGDRLGPTVGVPLQSALQFPQCYLGECAQSDLGRDTQVESCSTIAACIQAIVVSGQATTSNVCNITNVVLDPIMAGGTPLPSSPLSFVPWIPLLIFLIILVVIVLLIMLFTPKYNRNRVILIPQQK